MASATPVTHRERIRSLLNGKVIDRPPYALWRHFPVDDQSPSLLADAHLRFQRTYDFDLLKVTPASSYSVIDYGVVDEWRGNVEGTRTYIRYPIQRPRDWTSLRPLDQDSPGLQQAAQTLRLVRATLGPDTPILATVFSPLAQAKHLAGAQGLHEHLQSDAGSVLAGLQTILESTKNFLRLAAAAGADGIFFAIQHAEPAALDKKGYRQFGLPLDREVLTFAAGFWCNMIHLHGTGVYFDLAAELPAQIVNWHDREGGPSLALAGQTVGGALCGGLARSTLTLGSPSQVRAETLDAVQQAGPRLLLSTGCVIPLHVAHGNIHAGISALKQP